MKELTIEEKAKRYDEALERAKKLYNDGNSPVATTVEGIFPELKESEDERIRSIIKKSLKAYFEGNLAIGTNDTDYAECLAWLEKQGEQMSEHFELKAGHWYICHRAYCCRADHLTVKEGERFMCEKDGIVKGFVIKEPEKYFKEVCAPAPMEDEQKPADNVEPKFKVGDVMRTIQEAKDGWTDGMPVVVSIDNEYYRCNNEIIAIEDQDNYEYPPINRKHNAWSEQDEKIYNLLYEEYKNIAYYSHSRKKAEDIPGKVLGWIKSIKERYNWKPSDEQIEALEFYIKRGFIDKEGVFGKRIVELCAQLKKLREE